MALITSGAGPYTMTYQPSGTAAGSALGATAAGLVKDVRVLSREWISEPVISDLYGEVDDVITDVVAFLSMTLIEWTAVNRAMLWPFGPTNNTGFGNVGVLGRLGSDLAGQIVLTAATGSPAASNGFATLTAPKALIAPRTRSDILLGAKNRETPVVFKLYKVDNAGTIRHFTYT